MRKLNKYRHSKTIKEYLSQRVKKLDNGCIEFTGPKDKDGYGQCHTSVVGKKHKVSRTHQLAYVEVNGPVPSGKIVCHTCDNPSCVNVDHLFIGTFLDNNMDKINKGRANSSKGVTNGASKLTEEDVISIRQLKGIKTSLEVGVIYNTSYSNVCRIWRKEGWGHI